MSIRKPIFIIGSGRSGTTILYNLLSVHPDVCWFSNYSDRFHTFKYVSFIHRVLDIPIIGNWSKHQIINSSGPKWKLLPNEAQRIYHDYSGFRHDIRTIEDDRNPDVESKFKGLISQHIAMTGKERFLSKQTANNQRIRLINSMFEDAYFIHIIRDGRAVASSLHNVNWWNEVDLWWLGIKVKNWDASEHDMIELCARHWQKDVEEILQNRNLYKDRYLELKYEELVVDVRATMTEIINFCQLSHSSKFMSKIPPTLPNMNYKWKEMLNMDQQSILSQVLNPFLAKLGYQV